MDPAAPMEDGMLSRTIGDRFKALKILAGWFVGGLAIGGGGVTI
jgi:hypothetical protein